MVNDIFSIIKEKIASRSGHSVEEIEQYFDKQMITENTNKEGNSLYLLRRLVIKEVVKGSYDNRARYRIYTQDGQFVGYIDVVVSNSRDVNRAEIIANANEGYRNKGNIPICLEEVLKDIFVDKSFDELQVKECFNKTKIQLIFLDIDKNNIASQKSASKSGFIQTKDDGYRVTYEITKEAFLERRKKQDQEEERE